MLDGDNDIFKDPAATAAENALYTDVVAKSPVVVSKVPMSVAVEAL